MVVVATAPMPGRRTPSFPSAGRIEVGCFIYVFPAGFDSTAMMQVAHREAFARARRGAPLRRGRPRTRRPRARMTIDRADGPGAPA